ncbi:hypothetical protein [Marimonas arenosa]|uniref:Uncharacterized protein n=1 Tax=Marimonas arenosa TaxID=1795305 RepID=A0AAE3WFB1_9RHOB|nr:hypothetical protein [Marimonas arenosa]MDQ2091644.1 hypothetical protein [Marimonas arenosa]
MTHAGLRSDGELVQAVSDKVSDDTRVDDFAFSFSAEGDDKLPTDPIIIADLPHPPPQPVDPYSVDPGDPERIVDRSDPDTDAGSDWDFLT